MPSIFEARLFLAVADLRHAAWLSVALQAFTLCVALWAVLLLRRRG